jgi:hypothetical protein
VADYAEGHGGLPPEIVDVRLMERFGWTPQELDDVDEAVTFPAIAAANLAEAAKSVYDWLDAAGAGRKVPEPTAYQIQALNMVKQARKEQGRA